MVELNPTFAAHLRSAFNAEAGVSRRRRSLPPRRRFGAAARPDGHVGRDGQFDLVISGLPLNNFSSDDVSDILQAYSRLLKPGGVLSFFQYILHPSGENVRQCGRRARSVEERRRRDRRHARRAGIRARVGMAECAARVGSSPSVLSRIGKGRGKRYESKKWDVSRCARMASAATAAPSRRASQGRRLTE